MPGRGRRAGDGAVVDLDLATDLDVAGRKAAALARLRAEGERVPPGFVLTLRAFAAEGSPAGVADDVDRLLAALDAPAVAVRSSGVAEDGAVSALAGRHLTVLHVPAVPHSVLDVAARVAASGPDVAVLVQPMLDPQVAGVAFSADPVTGDPRVVIEAVPGLGDALLAGEATGERWFVDDDGAHPAGTGGPPPAGTGDGSRPPVLDVDRARALAEVVRRLARRRGHEVDVEWAWCVDGLWLLQERPITALPVAPEIDIPPGTWEKDVTHSPRPLSPLAASLQPRTDAVVAAWTARWGLLIAGLRSESFGGEIYTQPVPLVGNADAGPPPPWWVLGALARLAPPVRRRMTAARRALAEGRDETALDLWSRRWRPWLEAEIARHRAVDLSALSGEALVEAGEGVLALIDRATAIHFDLFVPYLLGVHRFVEVAEDLLGWSAADAVRVLAGHSPASAESARLLGAVAAAVRAVPGAPEAVMAAEDPLEVAAAVSLEAAGAVAAWRDRVGSRLSDYDVASPVVEEVPGLAASLLRAALDRVAGASSSAVSRGAAAPSGAGPDPLDEARRRLAGVDRERFEAAHAGAARVFGVREDNVHLAGTKPWAQFRRVALEAGSRIAATGALDDGADVFWLTWPEVRTVLVGESGVDPRPLVRRRRAETAWVLAHPGPPFHGPEPGDPPDLRGLPRQARRVNAALIWAMGQELAAPRETGSEALRGLGCGAGVHTGPVRIVRSEADLGHLRPGDVLVCSIAATGWAPAFSVVGALVCDGGGALSHSAIVAREHGVPAVMAAGSATRVLRDGDVLRVDGTTGSVERIETVV